MDDIRAPLHWRMMRDVELRPFEPLIGGRFIHPTGVTMLYGMGGIGKGLIACYEVRQLIVEGITPLVIDFEQREQEWKRRLPSYEDGSFHYIDPSQDIAYIRREVAERVSDLHIGCIIIDSASLAVPEVKGGQDAAMVRKMFACLRSFDCPSLVIAHVPKSTEKEGEYRHIANPLGSIQWTNQARLTWSGIPRSVAPSVTGLETRAMKVNDRQRPETRVWEFYHNATSDALGEVRTFPLGGRSFSVSREIWNLLDKADGKIMAAAEISFRLMTDFPQHQAKMGRLQVQRLLYRRKDELFRKMPGGWTSIDSDRLFAWKDQEVEE